MLTASTILAAFASPWVSYPVMATWAWWVFGPVSSEPASGEARGNPSRLRQLPAGDLAALDLQPLATRSAQDFASGDVRGPSIHQGRDHTPSCEPAFPFSPARDDLREGHFGEMAGSSLLPPLSSTNCREELPASTVVAIAHGGQSVGKVGVAAPGHPCLVHAAPQGLSTVPAGDATTSAGAVL